MRFKLKIILNLTMLILLSGVIFAGDIYINSENHYWYETEFRELCDLAPSCAQLTGNALDVGDCCNEKWCDDLTDFEGNYYYTYVVNEGINATFDMRILGYTVNFDQDSWACVECGGTQANRAVWDSDSNKCCGDDSIAEDDPDEGEISCSGCPRGLFSETPYVRDWNNSASSINPCCGDDSLDCGVKAGNNEWLCSNTPTKEQGVNLWKWDRAISNKGVIWDSTCNQPNPDVAYLSDGIEWIECSEYVQNSTSKYFSLSLSAPPAPGQTQNPIKIDLNEYMCFIEYSELDVNRTIEINAYRIAECCGELSTCQNDGTGDNLGGISLAAGGSVVYSSKDFFCREDLTFSEDLDDSEIACNNAKYPNGSTRNFLWTGNRCCSEPADGKENYNDPFGTINQYDGGACFNGTVLRNDGGPHYNEKSLKSMNGTIMGCSIESNSYLLELKDDYTGEQLIYNLPYCTVDMTSDYYCDYSKEWKFNYERQLMTNLVYVPLSWKDLVNVTIEVEAGCCSELTCFDGTTCVENQGPNPLSPPKYLPNDNHRCGEGEWVDAELKDALITDSSNAAQGWCPKNEQCLVRTGGNYADNNNPRGDPQCITHGQFMGDSYCDEGTWSSRTKLLGNALLSIVDNPNNEYSLYCGPFDDTLNFYDYFTSSALYVIDIFEVLEYANHLCILKYENKTYVATSLNFDLDVPEFDIGELFPEFESCSINPGLGYYSCNGQTNDHAWYNTVTRSIFYSKDEFHFDTEIPARINSEFIQTNLDNLYDELLKLDLLTLTNSIFNLDFMNNGLRFGYMYLANNDDNKVFATLDDNHLIASYENVDSSKLCEVVNNYNYLKTGGIGNSIIKCIEESVNKANIVALGAEGTDVDPYAIWSDLTGKLRYNGVVYG